MSWFGCAYALELIRGEQQLTNLGTVQVQSSVYGAFLQAHHDNGQMHCSNGSVNQEETWFLIEVDKANHQYALQNWLTGNYMYKGDGSDTILADSQTFDALRIWTLLPGDKYGVGGGKVCFKAHDGWTMATNRPGDNYPNHDGEIYSSNGQPSIGNPGWAAWFAIQPASPNPQPGNNFGTAVWNAVGSVFQGIAVVAASAATDAVYAALMA